MSKNLHTKIQITKDLAMADPNVSDEDVVRLGKVTHRAASSPLSYGPTDMKALG